MTPDRHGTAVVAYPSDVEVVTTRSFDAPVGLVFDVMTRPEHVRQWFALFEDQVTVCEIDLRVGGQYHQVFVTPDGTQCSFRGAIVELDPPRRIVQTWHFEGWPGVEAVETVEFAQVDTVSTITLRLAFADAAGRAHLSRHDGQASSYDKLEDYLASLTGPA